MKWPVFHLTPEQHDRHGYVLPLLAVTGIYCQHPSCGACHGIAITAGWWFWSVTLEIVFPG